MDNPEQSYSKAEVDALFLGCMDIFVASLGVLSAHGVIDYGRVAATLGEMEIEQHRQDGDGRPLRHVAVEMLRQWAMERCVALQQEATAALQPGPALHLILGDKKDRGDA